MVPNYKRPKYRDYIYDVLERPLDDRDLDMIVHIEELENKEIILNTIKVFLQGEEFRINHALHELGNSKRAEYSGLLLGKGELIRTIKWRIKDIEQDYEVSKMFGNEPTRDGYALIPTSELERYQNKINKAFSTLTLMLMDDDVTKEQALITIKDILTSEEV